MEGVILTADDAACVLSPLGRCDGDGILNERCDYCAQQQRQCDGFGIRACRWGACVVCVCVSFAAPRRCFIRVHGAMKAQDTGARE